MGTGAGATLLVFAVISAAAFTALRALLGHDRGTERIVERDINDN